MLIQVKKHKPNLEYSRRLRDNLLTYRQLKDKIRQGRGKSETHDTSATTALDFWGYFKKQDRKELQRIAYPKIDYITIVDPVAYENVTRIWKRPFTFSGTKDELREYLELNYGRYICSDYDCTGQVFTRGFIIGYLGNNQWKIGERLGLDV